MLTSKKKYPLAEVCGQSAERCSQCFWRSSNCKCVELDGNGFEFLGESFVSTEPVAADHSRPNKHSNDQKQKSNKKSLNERTKLNREFNDISKFMKRNNMKIEFPRQIEQNTLLEEKVDEKHLFIESNEVTDKPENIPVQCEDLIEFLLLNLKQHCPGCWVHHTPKGKWCTKFKGKKQPKYPSMASNENTSDETSILSSTSEDCGASNYGLDSSLWCSIPKERTGDSDYWDNKDNNRTLKKSKIVQ